jgi:hypothetical protein
VLTVGAGDGPEAAAATEPDNVALAITMTPQAISIRLLLVRRGKISNDISSQIGLSVRRKI